MNLFEEFNQSYEKGFLLCNYYQELQKLKEKFNQNEIILQKYGENFFFYENQRLYFFINENKNFNIKPSYAGIITKGKNTLEKYQDFLEKNHFIIHQKFLQMSLKNHNLQNKSFDFISQALSKDSRELYDFFKAFFNTNYLFHFNTKHLQDLHQNVLIYKEKGRICGALLFNTSFHTAFLEFIAVNPNLQYKNVAFALLCGYFSKNQQSQFFKLFVDEKNEKAIHFYKRAGFEFNSTVLQFYRNF